MSLGARPRALRGGVAEVRRWRAPGEHRAPVGVEPPQESWSDWRAGQGHRRGLLRYAGGGSTAKGAAATSPIVARVRTLIAPRTRSISFSSSAESLPPPAGCQ